MGMFIGILSIFIVNGAIAVGMGSILVPSDCVGMAFGTAIAALIAIRLWSVPEFQMRSAWWWLSVAAGSLLLGGLFFWLDIALGFIRLSAIFDVGFLRSINNMWAVIVSLSFFPFFVAIAMGGAARAAWLQRKFANS